MIGDIIALIDFIKDFIQGKSDKKTEMQRNLIEDFVNPVFLLFKTVHDDYLTTFRKYQDAIDSSNPLQLSLIIEDIKRDSLFSHNLRDELAASLSVDNDSLSEFISAIYQYLEFSNIFLNQTIQPWSNVRRDSLIVILGWIDQLTPEIVIGSGLLSDIHNFSQNQRIRLRQTRTDAISELVSSLEIIIRSPNAESSLTNISEDDLAETREKINDIKKYLAIQCMNFIIQETRENYRLVAEHYYQFKCKLR